MAVHILDAMARAGFEEVHALHDARSGLRAFLGLHDSTRGPAFGGIRRWAYRDEREALLDCLRLSQAMTHKCLLADLPAGGAKIVVMDRDGLDVDRAYRFLGEAIERLGGRVFTGPDVGTAPEHLACVAETTQYVAAPGADGPGELAASTAAGVFYSIQSALQALDGDVDWPRRTIVVQGLGGVGSVLAHRLRETGARVVACDLELETAESVARESGIEVVPTTEVLDVPCDVLAPCALGGIMHDLSIERLRCRAVVGSANNVLARPLHGDRLHDRGILYGPDIIVTSGALIRGALFHLEGRRVPVEDIGRRVGQALSSVFERAAEEGAPPSRVAVREAEERLAAVRDPAPPEALAH